MNKNKGFTLIELLVVIAIIGILSSVVLASLNTARIKGKVAAVQSVISSLRAQAELGVDQDGKFPATICDQSTYVEGGRSPIQGELKQLLDSIDSNSLVEPGLSSKTVKDSLHCGINLGKTQWGAEVSINGKWYCSDSSGFSGEINVVDPGSILSGVTSADVVCVDDDIIVTP